LHGEFWTGEGYPDIAFLQSILERNAEMGDNPDGSLASPAR